MRALGLLLVLSPLLVIAVTIAHFKGWRVALGILGVVALGVVVVAVGTLLMMGDTA